MHIYFKCYVVIHTVETNFIFVCSKLQLILLKIICHCQHKRSNPAHCIMGYNIPDCVLFVYCTFWQWVTWVCGKIWVLQYFAIINIDYVRILFLFTVRVYPESKHTYSCKMPGYAWLFNVKMRDSIEHCCYVSERRCSAYSSFTSTHDLVVQSCVRKHKP